MNLTILENNIDLLINKVKKLNNELIIFPTDTVYGLGIKISKLEDFKENIKKIYIAKQRESSKQIILLLSDIELIYNFISDDYNIRIKKIIDSFLPGDLTIIFNSNEYIKNNTGYETIGIRIPNNNLIRKFIREIGGYIFTSSANLSGEKSPKYFSDISNELLKNVEIKLINDDIPKGVASTIIKYSNNKIELIREGSIAYNKIKEAYENSNE